MLLAQQILTGIHANSLLETKTKTSKTSIEVAKVLYMNIMRLNGPRSTRHKDNIDIPHSDGYYGLEWVGRPDVAGQHVRSQHEH